MHEVPEDIEYAIEVEPDTTWVNGLKDPVDGLGLGSFIKRADRHGQRRTKIVFLSLLVQKCLSRSLSQLRLVTNSLPLTAEVIDSRGELNRILT